MQNNIDKWLRLKSKTEENYRNNLEIITNIKPQLKYNSQNDIVALAGYIFDTKGNLKRIHAGVESIAAGTRSPKRSSRSSEDEQYMDDLIDHFQ